MTRIHILILAFSMVALPVAGKPQYADEVLDTKYFPPVGDSKNVAIMMLGGSEGGFPDYFDTEGLTESGYSCLVVGYLGTENTPDRLEMIPLEYFEAVIKAFRARPEIADSKLVVWGGSKGGELALLLASRYKEIEGVIAVVPSSVVFQGIGGRLVSSWSCNGESIPFVPYAPYDWSTIVSSQYIEAYRLSLEQTDAVEKAAIEVEKINGPILILSGKEDTMWPSSQMGDMIVDRLEKKEFSFWFRHYAYEGAGHTLNDGYMMGGTEEGNREARIDSEKRTIEFLEILSRKR